MQPKVIKFEIGKLFAVVVVIIAIALIATLASRSTYFKGAVMDVLVQQAKTPTVQNVVPEVIVEEGGTYQTINAALDVVAQTDGRILVTKNVAEDVNIKDFQNLRIEGSGMDYHGTFYSHDSTGEFSGFIIRNVNTDFAILGSSGGEFVIKNNVLDSCSQTNPEGGLIFVDAGAVAAGNLIINSDGIQVAIRVHGLAKALFNTVSNNQVFFAGITSRNGDTPTVKGNLISYHRGQSYSLTESTINSNNATHSVDVFLPPKWDNNTNTACSPNYTNASIVTSGSGAADYVLGAASTCLDAVTVDPAEEGYVAVDMLGTVRPQGASHDIGALESL